MGEGDIRGNFRLSVLNLLFFGGLVFLVNIVFFWHLRRTEESFLAHARRDALLVARMVSLNTETGTLSEHVVKTLVRHFLENLGKFLDHLELIEPFSKEELEAFRVENNLFGVRIKRFDGTLVEVPKGWLKMRLSSPLSYFPEKALFIYRMAPASSCEEIILSVQLKDFKDLYEKTSEAYIFRALTELPGILYLQEEKTACPEISVEEKEEAIEARLPLGGRCLTVGINNQPLLASKKRLWKQYFILNAILIPAGFLLSYLLYRFQRAYLRRFEAYERELSKRREEAALGRTAAALAHEIKNPLNSISMALQRLLLEGENLSSEQKYILSLIFEAVKRTNRTVNSLLNYARLPEKIEAKPVKIKELIGDLISLFTPELTRKKVRLETRLGDTKVMGDPHLLSQMLENLIKNALEAVEPGGLLRISLTEAGEEIRLVIENTGDLPPQDKIEQIFQPYVTFKTRGVGLGLAIVQKIVKIHRGKIRAEILDGLFRIEVKIPRGRNDEDPHR